MIDAVESFVRWCQFDIGPRVNAWMLVTVVPAAVLWTAFEVWRSSRRR